MQLPSVRQHAIKKKKKKNSVERYKLHAVAERLIKQETNHQTNMSPDSTAELEVLEQATDSANQARNKQQNKHVA